MEEGKNTGKRLFGSTRRRWEDNIRLDFKERGVIPGIDLFLLPFSSSFHSIVFFTTIEWDDGVKGNKNMLILTEIFPSVHET